jgi:hypothetical protein
MTAIYLGTATDVLFERCHAPQEALRRLRELGYASKDKADRDAAEIIDTWKA